MILAKVQVTYLEKILEDLVLGPYKMILREPQHESLYPTGLKSARIEIPHIGFHYRVSHSKG